MTFALSNSSSIFYYNPNIQINTWKLGLNESITIQYRQPSELSSSSKVFSYMLDTVATQLNMSSKQMAIAQQVQEFCISQNITATNSKVLENPRDAMDVFVVRLIKSVYKEKILPQMEKIVSLFERLWTPSKSFSETEFDSNGVERLKNPPLFIFKKDLQLDCDQWKINFTEENQKLLESYFELVKGWYSFRLLHDHNKDPQKFAEMLVFIGRIERATSEMNKHFPAFAEQCERAFDPNYKGTVIGTENYLPFVRTKLLLKDYVTRILTPDVKSTYEYYERLANQVIKTRRLSADFFDL